MSRYEISKLTNNDFPAIMKMEDEVFGQAGEAVLGAYYVRLCCEFFGDTCFVARVEGRPVAYVLCFVRDREAYCTTLGVHPDYQATRVVPLLLRALISEIAYRVDKCWFTVTADNLPARRLHKSLGATDVDTRLDFYGPGDERIVSVIDRAAFERLRARYEKLGLIAPAARPAAQASSAEAYARTA